MRTYRRQGFSSYSTNSSECWVEKAGSDSALYLAVFPMKDSGAQRRQAVLQRIIRSYKTAVQSRRRPALSKGPAITCAGPMPLMPPVTVPPGDSASDGAGEDTAGDNAGPRNGRACPVRRRRTTASDKRCQPRAIRTKPPAGRDLYARAAAPAWIWKRGSAPALPCTGAPAAT